MEDKEQIEEMIRIVDKNTNTTCFSRDKKHIKCEDCEKCWTYSIAKILYNEGYRKIIWHKVTDGDLPKRRNGEICAVPVQAYYIDRNGLKSNGPLYYFFIDNTFHSIGVPDAVNVIAWTELPKYKENEK